MSQIGENKIGIFELNNILYEIENIIKILNYFEGKVFGEYVREVIVPRMKNSDCDVTFNCVDIWFQNQIKADDFIKLMNIDKFNYHVEPSQSKNIDFRTFHELNQYFLREKSYVKFNIIVNPSLPINNFDVNCLTYFYSGDKQVIETGFPEDKKEQIIEAIYKKEATMTKYYFFNMINHPLTYSERSQMINIFENRGWVIIHDGIKFTSPFTGTFEDAKAKEKFVNEILLKRSKEKSMKIDFQWSPEKAEIAKHNNTFIRVGGVKTCYRLLSEALKSWTSNDREEQRTIFNLEYRITGTVSNIFTVLKNVGYKDSEIKQIINNSITKDNYFSSKKIEYLKELEREQREEREERENGFKKNSEKVICNPEYRIIGTPLDISNALKNSGISDKDLSKKKDEDISRKQLINNFTLSDELFKIAIVNRNKAFFECISDFGITDKVYVSNRIIDYPEELSSKLIIEELIIKK